MIKVISLVTLSFVSLLATAQSKGKKSPMAWLTVAEAQAKMDKETRPVLVDVYTDWCHYCKVMDATTWVNPQVTDYVARFFYPVKFNAESKEPASWMGKDYAYKPAYKVHMLAAAWLQGNIVYPSTVIIPPNGAEPVVIPGVIEVKDLEPVLNYFGEKHYLTATWEDYKAAFKNKWK